ncbi:MAG: glycoside hydrolase family 3 C-terminal domain-containing protein [Bacteroidales bacterium]|nr:glycoside hydrolase family 3 C-terminal domain-containing protein [Bacteroidales bacterium]
MNLRTLPAGKITYVLFVLSLIYFQFSCKPTGEKEYDYESRIDSLISLMTLEEKVNMIHGVSSFNSGGVERLGIPELVMSDGPHGVRREFGRDWKHDDGVDDSATYLPTCITLAATWNKDLGYAFGQVLGSEARARGKDIILGPGVNIIRTPLNGRNFEYLSEDPFLNSTMVVGYIKGVQDQDVSACIKHYIANNQETNRGSVNVEMSERTLREIYLPVFEKAVREAGVRSLMGAYNKFRGQYCTYNEYLVNKVLKEEFGFNGIVISDWSAVHNTMEALYGGTDIEMGTDLKMKPNPDFSKFFMADTVISLVKSGEVSESVIDEKVRRILRVMFQTNIFSENRKTGSFDTPENHQVALKVAEEGIVLLKNDQILPLSVEKMKTIAVIGDNATRKHALGGGSSEIIAQYEITPLEGLKKLVKDNIDIKFAPGYTVTLDTNTYKTNREDAIKLAKECDVVIFVGGWMHDKKFENGERVGFDTEGRDKKNLILPFGQDQLINELYAINQNMLVVLYGGGPANISSWVNKVKAIIQAWYPGMEGGTALANIIFGKTNPSGRLPMTFANTAEEYPSHYLGEYPGEDLIENYKEGIFVGYRYFDTYDKTPQFCFGHGLSYTSFKYSDITCKKIKDEAWVTVKLENNGLCDGAEVVQLYVTDTDYKEVDRPVQELKGFEKVFLTRGEVTQVKFLLDTTAFSFYDELNSKWKMRNGSYIISIGSSSRDIRQKCELIIQ